jgi:hypothetical protein
MLILKKLFLSVILILVFRVCYPQTPPDFPVIGKSDLPGAKFSSSRTFTGSSLYGYIDGGAELFLEYGFNVAAVMEIEYSGGRYKTEIYEMSDPEAAFGIFSVSKYRCLGMPDFSEFTCQTKYQLQICKGNFYISIINKTGNSSDSIASIKIGKAIANKIKEGDIDFSSYFPCISPELIKSKCVLARGKLGIENGAPSLEDYLKGAEKYTAVFFRGETNTILSIKFAGTEFLEKFLALRNWKDGDISNIGFKGSMGEKLKKITDNHLFIELPY